MHEILLKTKRYDYIDTCFYGSVFLAKKNGIYKSFGDSKDTICFMRSLAKPMQSSILFDCSIIKDYKIKDSGLAIFSGSHAGSETHIKLLKNILKKHDLKISDLSICPIDPLDKRKFNGRKTKLHNNCSGKHLMMLLVCKYLKFDYDYTKFNHPLQKIIKEKQEKLTGYKSDLLTYDGCSTPLWGLPYENIIKGYFNLIDSHPGLIKAIIKNPDIYGGFGRFDSEIIKLSKGKLFAKVGAGGLVIVYNFKKDEILLLKLAQDNNEIRRIITLDYLNKLKWLNYKTDNNIYNQKKQIVAKYEFSLR